MLFFQDIEGFLRGMMFSSSASYPFLVQMALSFLIMLITSNTRTIIQFVSKLGSIRWFATYRVVLNGMIVEDKHDVTVKISSKLKGLIYHINNHCMLNPELKRLVEVSFKSFYHFTDDMHTEFLIDQNTSIEIEPGVYCDIAITQENHMEQKKMYKVNTITATIYSKQIGIQGIKDIMTRYEDDYHDFLSYKVQKQIYCFLFTQDDEGGIPQFSVTPFSSTKTFDNLVFHGKSDLKERIDFFTNSRGFYDKLGIPYTLGMLFYGSPGTGKTSTIKAIANYTGRHIIAVPMSKVKKSTTLRNILLEETIGDFKIPHHKRLYVFEEVDCNGMEKIIQKRRDIETQEQPRLDDEMLKQALNELRQTDAHRQVEKELLLTTPLIGPKEKTVQDDITLGSFLELIDGINEASGRMLIMTTNNDPKKFDDALLRPGRIDIKLEFKKCSRDEICDLFKLWFGKEVDKGVRNHLKDMVYSPAELGEIFLSNINEPDAIIEKISSHKDN